MTGASVAERDVEANEMHNLMHEPPNNQSINVKDSKRNVLDLFKKYDFNHDGYLELLELRQMIRDRRCTDLPKRLAKSVLNRYDKNGDGKLSFEEFYKLSTDDPWFVKYYCVKYCQFLIPSRSQNQAGAYEFEMFFYPPPLTMVLFSLLQIVTFFWSRESTSVYKMLVFGDENKHQIWRFLSYMLLHSVHNFSHLFSNVIIQIFFGTFLELVHCWWRIATIYLFGVASGAIIHAWLRPESNVIGASGGVYALITAHMAVIILNWNEMKSGFYQLIFFSLFILTDVIFVLHEPHKNVSHAAHLGGGIAGLLVGIGVLRNLKVEKHEKYVWWASVTIFTILMFCGIVHIFRRS